MRRPKLIVPKYRTAGPGGTKLITQFLYKRALSAAPIIIVGMHRSGTTLLVRILEQCNVFMGNPQTKNGESTFFQNINKDVLDMLGCGWRCLDFLPDTKLLHNRYLQLQKRVIHKVREGYIREYWGRRALFLLSSNPFSWGWKDPRNSLLLPVWHKVFPDAKVIHIFRDGRDVALSIFNREINYERGEDIFNKEEMEKRIVANVTLWENYIKRVEEAIPFFESPYSIKYEQLLASPAHEIEKLWRHLGLSAHKSIKKVASIVDSSRVKRYEKNDFFWICDLIKDSPILKKLGYT